MLYYCSRTWPAVYCGNIANTSTPYPAIDHKGVWSSGMIPASGAGGRGFDSPNSPESSFVARCYAALKELPKLRADRAVLGVRFIPHVAKPPSSTKSTLLNIAAAGCKTTLHRTRYAGLISTTVQSQPSSHHELRHRANLSKYQQSQRSAAQLLAESLGLLTETPVT